MKPLFNWLFLALLIAILATEIFFHYRDSRGKTAYVQNTEIFNQFLGKKELEKHLIKMQNQHTGIIDSLKVEIQILDKKISMEKSPSKTLIEKYKMLSQLYRQSGEEFSGKEEEQRQKYIDEIWKQINQYVLEYGRQHRYQYIYGADGSGAIMYADSADNITAQVVEYINKKYEGH